MKWYIITLLFFLGFCFGCSIEQDTLSDSKPVDQVHIIVSKQVVSTQNILNKDEEYEVFAALNPRSQNGYVYLINTPMRNNNYVQYYVSSTEYSYAFRDKLNADSVKSGFKQVGDSPEMRDNALRIFERVGLEFMAHGLDSMSTYVYRDSFTKAKKHSAFYKRNQFSHEVVYINPESSLPERKVVTQYVNGDTTITTWQYEIADQFTATDVFDRQYIDNELVVEKITYFPNHRGHSNFKFGDGFPSIPLKDNNGNKFFLEKLTTKPTVLFVYFNDCPPCKEAIPEINQLADKYNDIFQFIGVNWIDGEDAALKPIQPKLKFSTYGSVDDQAALDDLLIENYPTIIILSADRQILYNGSFISSKFNRNLDEYLDAY